MRVEWSLSTGSIFSRGKNRQISIGKECDGGEYPRIFMGWVIGKPPTLEINFSQASIVEFNPIGSIIILIDKDGLVGSHELRYGDLLAPKGLQGRKAYPEDP